MFHYQDTVSTFWSLMLILNTGKLCHMPFKLLAINKTDDTAIHHVILFCFIFKLSVVWVCVVCVCGCLWFYQSILVCEYVCACARDERKAWR